MPERKIYTNAEIVQKIITEIGNKSTNLTDMGEGSNIRSLVDAFAYYVEYMQLQINNAFESFKMSKANGTDLDNRVKDFGIIRNSSTPAYGNIKFGRNTGAPAAFVISAGSQVSTVPDVFGNTIDYTLDSDLTFASGALAATGQVTCTVDGIIGNVPSGYITNITSSIPGVDYVINEVAYYPGANEETDEALKKRVPIFLNGLKMGNEDAIKSAVSAIPGVTIVRVIEELGQINVFVSTQSGVLTDQQKQDMLTVADKAAAFGITVSLTTPTIEPITISCDISYDEDNYIENELAVIIKEKINSLVIANSEIKTINGISKPVLKLSDIIVMVNSIPGVVDISDVKINNIASNYVATQIYNVLRFSNNDYTSGITLTMTGE